MTSKIKISELPVFDAAAYLDSDDAILAYITVALEENDTRALMDALRTVARARGMANVAARAQIGREALYKALRSDAQPRFETVMRVCAALGLRLTVERGVAVAPAHNAADD